MKDIIEAYYETDDFIKQVKEKIMEIKRKI